MPDDQLVQLPDGSTIPRSEWDKIPTQKQVQVVQSMKQESIQNKSIMPMLLGAAGSGMGAAPYNIAMNQDPDKFYDFVKHDLPYGVAGGAAMALGGAPIGAALGTGAMLAGSAPHDLGGAVMNAANVFGMGLANKASQAYTAIKSPVSRFLARAATGLGINETQNKIQDALGQGANEGASRLMSDALAALVPGMGGSVADRANLRGNIQGVMGPNVPSTGFEAQAAQEAQKVQQAVPEAGFLQQQKFAQTQQAAKMFAENNQKLEAERLLKLTAPQGSFAQDDLQKAKSLAENNKLRAGYAKVVEGQDVDNPQVKAIKNLQQQYDDISNQEGGPWKDASYKNAQLKQIQEEIDKNRGQMFDQMADKVRQAAEQHVNNLYDPALAATQRLNKVSDTIRSAVNTEIIENSNLKGLLTPDKDGVFGPKQLVGNLINGDSDNIDRLFKYLGNQKNGDQMIKTTRDAFLTEMMARAYDPQTKQLSNIGKITAGDGPFNRNKLISIFGGGREGQETTKQVDQLLQDFKTLQDVKDTAKKSTGFGHLAGWYFTPMGATYAALHYGLHTSYPAAMGSAALAGVASKGAQAVFQGYIPLIDKYISNPQFAQAFHNWAQTGGDMKTMFKIPMLSRVLVGSGKTSNNDLTNE